MLARMQRKWITQTFANRNVKWNSHSRNGHGTFSTGLNMPLPCDPAVALLASTPEMITLCPHKNLYTDFITVKPKCPSVGERFNKLVHSYQGILLSNKNQEMIHATIWMNLKRAMLNKKRQSQKVTYGVISFI